MTQDSYNPADIEEIILKIISKLSGSPPPSECRSGEGETLSINEIITELKEQGLEEIKDSELEKVCYRFVQEGFLLQKTPGTVTLLPIGDIDLSDDFK
jgi:hypothetical protein